MKKYLLALFLLLPLVIPAKADSLVVQTCGTLPLAYAPGATRYDTVDINGNKCISGSISASFFFVPFCECADAHYSDHRGCNQWVLYGRSNRHRIQHGRNK